LGGTSKERTSTIRLGILEILYQSTMEDEDEEEEEEEEVEEEANANEDEDTSKLSDDDSKTKKKDSTKSRKKRKKTRRQNDEDEAAAVGWPTRVWKSSGNVWKHMQFNAQLLYQATQEDFTGRTLAAASKIQAELPKTLERTLDLMRRVITWDWGPPPPPSTGAPPPMGPGGPPPLV